ncbi:DNA-processing protein DprA [Rickettsiella endosymbiont of Dermanyssus gallinae]|uniref:DNA-processing protein DprA n=1 Tax=Rickettsiella endosymbiont of Dermanyssus gallinae TaxID=2856608 RepID=UPI001C52FFE7|nr:DNA-processing protein DprA [Rickettsiella endosymbiont of Dermanyssus gallinae]
MSGNADKHSSAKSILRDWLAVYTVPQCGFATVLKLLAVFSTPTALLSASPEALSAAGISNALIAGLKKPDWKRVDACLTWREKPGRHILHWQNDLYPPLLREVASPPLVLFVEGDVSVLKDYQLAIVGTRQPSPIGLEIAHSFASELSQQGFVVTSGLARGIDGASHQGCLAASGKTIAVLGSGIGQIYPRCHRGLALQIVEKGGALISEFFPDVSPRTEHFPRRNRIISGLSVGVVVIEAAMRSGSLITARYAAEQGREVFAVPGSIANPLSRGCHALLKQGASLVESSHDILLGLSFATGLFNVAMGPIEGSFTVTDRPDSKPGLDSDDIKLVECLGFETTTIDSLVMRTGLTADRLLARLALLELQGYISAVPGGYARK